MWLEGRTLLKFLPVVTLMIEGTEGQGRVGLRSGQLIESPVLGGCLALGQPTAIPQPTWLLCQRFHVDVVSKS